MIYIYDVDGYVGDFGSRKSVAEFEDIAIRLGLKNLKELFIDGFSIDTEEVIEEFNKIDTSSFSELAETAKEILDIFQKSKEIIILTEGNE